jgi:hypothetical protein
MVLRIHNILILRALSCVWGLLNSWCWANKSISYPLLFEIVESLKLTDIPALHYGFLGWDSGDLPLPVLPTTSH